MLTFEVEHLVIQEYFSARVVVHEGRGKGLEVYPFTLSSSLSSLVVLLPPPSPLLVCTCAFVSRFTWQNTYLVLKQKFVVIGVIFALTSSLVVGAEED